MGLFGVAFIFATFGYIALEQRGRLIQRNEADMASNAFFMADHAARLFEVSDLTLRQTAALVEDESWYTIEPSRRLWEQLNAIKRALPYVDDIWLNDSTGRLRLTSAAFPTPFSDASDRDAFKEQAASDKGLFVGEPIIGRITEASDLHGEPPPGISRQVVPRHRLGHRGIELFQQLLGQFAAAQAKSHHVGPRHRQQDPGAISTAARRDFVRGGRS